MIEGRFVWLVKQNMGDCVGFVLFTQSCWEYFIVLQVKSYAEGTCAGANLGGLFWSFYFFICLHQFCPLDIFFFHLFKLNNFEHTHSIPLIGLLQTQFFIN